MRKSAADIYILRSYGNLLFISFCCRISASYTLLIAPFLQYENFTFIAHHLFKEEEKNTISTKVSVQKDYDSAFHALAECSL